MIPTKKQCEELHRKYARNEHVLAIFYEHCEIVAEIAVWGARHLSEPVDTDVVIAAALLHDVGSYMLCDDRGNIDTDYYQLHGLLGASILEDEGIDQRICDVVREHQFQINDPEIVRKILKTSPPYKLDKATIEAELVSYADRFHSKQPIFNSDTFLRGYLEELPDRKKVYQAWIDRFGLPDIEALAAKYHHPVR